MERKATQKHRELRRLAAKIKSPEQLDLIVNTAAPKLQAAVRSLLSQYVKYDVPDAPMSPS